MGIFEPFEAHGIRFAGMSCCFCDRAIEPGFVDPVTLTIEARSDRRRNDGFGVQTSWCHAECLEASGMPALHVTRREYWESLENEA